ncbi:LacI family transcriptional regulator [Fodinisporobacter ferrooxydans]|uniref:LacI family transcriptional regulator n=1 Tax=Fodinisporobacter ferrooxydans TaxID=2901836 RepID=A0ABY4CDR6_9BACL|nr:LacI family transcriptional regulator [Alicyclobacillaceae bacterium MYW30-H2]
MSLTINDIARLAGVSKATVSRVINNGKTVDPKLRDNVLSVIEQVNYRPSALARGLVKNESNLIGIIVPEIANIVFGVMLEGVSKVAEIYGYDIMLSLTEKSTKKEIHYLNLHRDKQVDGIILSSRSLKKEHIEIIERFEIPCVLIGQKSSVPGIPSVHLDNFSASYEAVKTLIRFGHRKIAMIRAPLDDGESGDERFRGYATALADEGIQFEDDWISVSDFSAAEGYVAMKQIIESGFQPTALFAASDKIALGAMNYLQDQGYMIPRDISIFGFDDMDVTELVRPKLSTVHYSSIEMGMTAFRNLIKLIKKEEIPAQHTNVPHQIILRDSVVRHVS